MLQESFLRLVIGQIVSYFWNFLLYKLSPPSSKYRLQSIQFFKKLSFIYQQRFISIRQFHFINFECYVKVTSFLIILKLEKWWNRLSNWNVLIYLYYEMIWRIKKPFQEGKAGSIKIHMNNNAHFGRFKIINF